MSGRYDAVVVGAGPNGLAAAATLVRAGKSVLVVEGSEHVGGGSRTAELTQPGFRHDVCSAVHPLGVASPLFRRLPLDAHGLRWAQPPAPLAHPLDGGQAAVVRRDLGATADGLGSDGPAYRRLLGPFVDAHEQIVAQVLGPLRPPRHPLRLARFGLSAIRPAVPLVRGRFTSEAARALLLGHAAHSILPLTNAASAGPGLLLGALAHSVGWPVPVGGSQAITDALAGYVRAGGGEIVTGHWVRDVDALPPARAVLLDVVPQQVLAMAGHRLPAGYRRQLARFRHGPGSFKVDYALSAPIPWAAEACREAGTVHVGGDAAEIIHSEDEVWRGRHAERPFVIVAQPSLWDDSRAPEGGHVAWAYCHVPHGSTIDMTERITAQIERFAPGFRDVITAQASRGPAEIEADNPNYVGGDIAGGAMLLRQLFTRPAVRPNPYTTPDPRLFLCSASTPPGGGVHGMCGWWAARTVLRRL